MCNHVHTPQLFWHVTRVFETRNARARLASFSLSLHSLVSRFTTRYAMPPRKKTKLTRGASAVDEDREGGRVDQDEEEAVERYQFPTVRPGEALVDSYTFHSSEPLATTSVEVEGAEKEEEGWMLGVDEAGRGPALGQSFPLQRQACDPDFARIACAEECRSSGLRNRILQNLVL